jgi:hypothetical protein
MIRSMSYSRNFRMPNPMLTGSASVPTAAATCPARSGPAGSSRLARPPLASIRI